MKTEATNTNIAIPYKEAIIAEILLVRDKYTDYLERRKTNPHALYVPMIYCDDIKSPYTLFPKTINSVPRAGGFSESKQTIFHLSEKIAIKIDIRYGAAYFFGALSHKNYQDHEDNYRILLIVDEHEIKIYGYNYEHSNYRRNGVGFSSSMYKEGIDTILKFIKEYEDYFY